MKQQRNVFFSRELSKAKRLVAHRTAAAALVASVFLGGSAFSGATDTTDTASASKIAAELLEKTGITEHLSLVSKTIGDEGYDKYATCLLTDDWKPGRAEERAFQVLIDRHFGAYPSHVRAVQSITERMSLEDLKAAQQFFDGAIGEKIVLAEKESKNFSEENFSQLADEYFNSSRWNTQRKPLIRQVYEATRAGRFVSILNGEMTVAITVSSVCDATTENYRQLSTELKSARSEARFVEPLMSGEVMSVIATIFRDISDADLQGYIDFAQSEPGKSFFNSLLESTRKGISGGLLGVRAERMATYEKTLSTENHND